jgi:hypothetical protein
MGCSLLPFPTAAIAAEAEQSAEVSFLEYLGMMVEADEKGVWLDPLDLDNDVLVTDRVEDQAQATDAPDPPEATKGQPLADGESS